MGGATIETLQRRRNQLQKSVTRCLPTAVQNLPKRVHLPHASRTSRTPFDTSFEDTSKEQRVETAVATLSRTMPIVPQRKLAHIWEARERWRGFVLFCITSLLWAYLQHVRVDAFFAYNTCAAHAHPRRAAPTRTPAPQHHHAPTHSAPSSPPYPARPNLPLVPFHTHTHTRTHTHTHTQTTTSHTHTHHHHHHITRRLEPTAADAPAPTRRYRVYELAESAAAAAAGFGADATYRDIEKSEDLVAYLELGLMNTIALMASTGSDAICPDCRVGLTPAAGDMYSLELTDFICTDFDSQAGSSSMAKVAVLVTPYSATTGSSGCI